MEREDWICKDWAPGYLKVHDIGKWERIGKGDREAPSVGIKHKEWHLKWPQMAIIIMTFVVVVQLLNPVQLFVAPWTAAHQTPLSSTITWTLLKFMSIESVTPSNHLILCLPFLFLPSVFPSIMVFSSESALRIRWPNHWGLSISPFHEYSGLISLDWLVWFPCCPRDSQRVFSSSTVYKPQFFFFPPIIFISWRLITLQYFSGFCHTLTWISHGFTCVPILNPPPKPQFFST